MFHFKSYDAKCSKAVVLEMGIINAFVICLFVFLNDNISIEST
jgi:hypothetical protein